MIELGKIYCEDCRETMKRMEDKSIDLIVTDFPYANETDYGVYLDTLPNLEKLITNSIPAMRRIADRVLLTCGVANIGLFPRPDWVLNWISTAGIGSGKWGFCCWQPILAYGNDPFLANSLGRRPDIILSNERSPVNAHPCPKPETLWRDVIRRGSVIESDVVYDPFMGSGTTAVACERLGRKWVGSEINPDYVKIAERRIRDERAQMKMEFK